MKTDPNTGRSRGFAFIVFNNAEAIDKVVAAGEHVINNKRVDPKKAKARHGKIFVGGLSQELSDDDIKNYFGQFGTVMIAYFSIVAFFIVADFAVFCFCFKFRFWSWRCRLTRQRIREKDSASSRSIPNKWLMNCLKHQSKLSKIKRYVLFGNLNLLYLIVILCKNTLRCFKIYVNYWFVRGKKLRCGRLFYFFVYLKCVTKVFITQIFIFF